MWWVGTIIGVLAIVGLVALITEAKTASWYDDETNRYYKTFEQLIEARKLHRMENTLIVAVFTLPKNIVMKVPLASIERIDWNVLIFKLHAEDYLLIRNNAEELAPAVSTNISNAVITFE